MHARIDIEHDRRDIFESRLTHCKKFTRSSRKPHIEPRYSGRLERCTGSITVSINQENDVSFHNRCSFSDAGYSCNEKGAPRRLAFSLQELSR